MKLYVATHNEHKLREISQILPKFEIVADDPAGVVEDAPDFAGNALIKVRAIASRHRGEWCMADDSGLEVAALGGAPGVRSARYAGEPTNTPANNALLLKNLEGVADRRANFTCAVALVGPDGREHVAGEERYLPPRTRARGGAADSRRRRSGLIFKYEKGSIKMSKIIPYKTYLGEDEVPKFWYNMRADMKKKPAPLIVPATGKPCTAEDLEPVFCKELVRQELDNDTAQFEIPVGIRDPTSTTSSRATTPPARTSSTRRSPRPTTPRSRASRASRPRRAPASGAPRSRWPARSSASTARSSW